MKQPETEHLAKVLAWRCNHHRRTGDGPCKVCGYACPFVSQDGYVIQPAKCDDVQAKDWEKLLQEWEEDEQEIQERHDAERDRRGAV